MEGHRERSARRAQIDTTGQRYFVCSMNYQPESFIVSMASYSTPLPMPNVHSLGRTVALATKASATNDATGAASRKHSIFNLPQTPAINSTKVIHTSSRFAMLASLHFASQLLRSRKVASLLDTELSILDTKPKNTKLALGIPFAIGTA